MHANMLRVLRYGANWDVQSCCCVCVCVWPEWDGISKMWWWKTIGTKISYNKPKRTNPLKTANKTSAKNHVIKAFPFVGKNTRILVHIHKVKYWFQLLNTRTTTKKKYRRVHYDYLFNRTAQNRKGG